MAEPIQYDFEFVMRAKSPWIAPFAKAMAALFYCIAIFGALAWHVMAGISLLLPDWKESHDFLAAYQPGMISISHFAVMAIASSLVSALYRNKDRIRIRALRTADERVATSAATKRSSETSRGSDASADF